MSQPLKTVCGWTVIHGQRELKRFEKENHISYRNEPPNGYPCLARQEICSDENAATGILERHELETMLAELKS